MDFYAISFAAHSPAPQPQPDLRPTADAAALARNPSPEVPLPPSFSQGGVVSAGMLRSSIIEVRRVDETARVLKPYGIDMLPSSEAREAMREAAKAHAEALQARRDATEAEEKAAAADRHAVDLMRPEDPAKSSAASPAAAAPTDGQTDVAGPETARTTAPDAPEEPQEA